MKYSLVVASLFSVAILAAQSGTPQNAFTSDQIKKGLRPLSNPARRLLFSKAIQQPVPVTSPSASRCPTVTRLLRTGTPNAKTSQ
jgi:hypothetical protein